MATYDPRSKKLGSYLVDAGLLDQSQVQIALHEQKNSGLRFGDIVVNRGWIKKQTLEYVIGKVVIFERSLGRPLNKHLFQKVYPDRQKRKSRSI